MKQEIYRKSEPMFFFFFFFFVFFLSYLRHILHDFVHLYIYSVCVRYSKDAVMLKITDEPFLDKHHTDMTILN